MQMSIPLTESLIAKLRFNFPIESMRLNPDGDSVAVFPPKHGDVGDLVIQVDGDEVTIYLGRLAHVHFGSYEDRLTDSVKAEQIAEDVILFLRKLFADEIEFYGTGWSGGCRERSKRQRRFLSKFFLGNKTYVWSGPLSENDA